MKRIVIFFGLLLSVNTLHAQKEWHLHQYHYFADNSYNDAGIWANGHYEILSNNITNEVMNQAIFDGKITPGATAYLDDLDSENYTRLSAGAKGSMWFRSADSKSWRWLVGVGFNDMAQSALRTGIVQLYLRGNGPYEDQTLALGPSFLTYHSYLCAGFGFEKNTKKTSWGITAQLIKSSRYANVSIGYSELYTAPYGTSVEADLAFKYDATNTSQNKLGAWYGTGYGVNAFFVHQPKHNSPLISIQVKDLGQLFYKGVNRYKVVDSFNFQGVEVDNVLQLDDSLINGGSIDSLEALVGLKESHPFARVTLPTNIQINYILPIGEKFSLSLQLRQYIRFGSPEVSAGFAYRAAKWLTLEPTIRGGGFSRFDYGLTAAINANNRFQLIVKTEQFERLLMPKNSSGQYLFVGGQFKF